MSTTTDSPWTDTDVETAIRAAEPIWQHRDYEQTYGWARREYTAVLDALAPRVAELQRAAKAEAWDEGRRLGQDVERRDPAFYTSEWIRNPYRADEIERGA